MADERSDAMKATNNTLTPPDQDLRTDRRDQPAGPVRERVEADSGGRRLAPNYGGGPGNRLNPDVDPAAPVARHGELAPAGDNAGPAATDLDEGANPTLAGQGAAGADAARVPDSMIADEAASNSVAGGGNPVADR